ncbi:hypothetical protein PHLGIDRAFT_84948 [Phlebiopsis gigantea 11061_1 CR5-6]|uniref:G-protein coupled receptors family 1 profile domain-containing protein n=1 Tax=Phlebiopsis gigantea (strain 11061_1 CR5-6) TaxID=745531 RepID=A0A0C3SEF3_PHLG1|nr:hypothetical protein PHLGIDRAFT_84948 [Phlebiopsis gigantea 11061_1 CR5-6]
MASLLVANLFASVSGILNSAWLSAGHINSGPLCTSQGTLSQVADVATAYFTGAIAVHTFNSLVLHRRLPLWFCGSTVAIGWAAAIAMAIVPAHFETKFGPFYSVDEPLCGISQNYLIWETCIHLLPIFVASLVAAVFYSLVFLILRGTVAFKGGLKFNLDLESRRNTMYCNTESPKFIASVARSMLWYPFVYIVLMFPHLVTCLMSASNMRVSLSARIFTEACEALLGLANVLIFYNTIRVMAPAFDAPTPSEKSESFVGGKEKDSPIDVAPPAAAFVRPAKAFPPPRVSSTVSVDSTKALLASRYKHAYSGSVNSSYSSISVARAITPASELNQMIATPPPVAGREKSLFHLDIAAATDDVASLPAPRRNGRSPVTRQPTLSTVASLPIDDVPLTAVPLKTPAGATSFAQNSQRDSFINMYASRSPAPGPTLGGAEETRTRFVPPALVVNDNESPVIPSTSSASAYTSTSSEASAAPSSAFADKQYFSATRRSLRSEVRARTSTIDAPASGLSPLAWASLVTDAATSHGGVHAGVQTKAEKRRSRSMDGLAVPTMLRPRVPASATLRREFTADLMPPISAGVPAARHQNRITRWDSKATFRQGPSKTPRLSASSDE